MHQRIGPLSFSLSDRFAEGGSCWLFLEFLVAIFFPSVFSVFVVSRHFWMGAFLFTSVGGSSSRWASYRDIGGHFQLSMEDIFMSSESEEEKRISHLLRVDKPGTFYKWSFAQRQLTQRDKPVAFSNINWTHLQPGSHTPRVKKLAGVCTFWPHSAKRSGGVKVWFMASARRFN